MCKNQSIEVPLSTFSRKQHHRINESLKVIWFSEEMLDTFILSDNWCQFYDHIDRNFEDIDLIWNDTTRNELIITLEEEVGSCTSRVVVLIAAVIW